MCSVRNSAISSGGTWISMLSPVGYRPVSDTSLTNQGGHALLQGNRALDQGREHLRGQDVPDRLTQHQAHPDDLPRRLVVVGVAHRLRADEIPAVIADLIRVLAESGVNRVFVDRHLNARVRRLARVRRARLAE